MTGGRTGRSAGRPLRARSTPRTARANGAPATRGSDDRFGFREIRFGAGADRTTVRVAAASRGVTGVLQVRLGSPKGRIVGVLPVRSTGGADAWREQPAKLPHPVTGSHDAHAVAAGGERTAAVGRLTFRKRAHGWGPGRRPKPRPPTAR
ncbi:carbohydrate-binding protein [Streptomyces sp. NPDC047939]|uniref:carbohydrate-binding protein n=1 Tax=Streptomyces sp. NPDC047939 TaxID=3155381 RepID=UPI00341E4FD6